MKFNELNIAEPILTAVCEKGYTEPTPIQQKAIPVVQQGKDIFGIAQTGTGKTAAFAIPIIQKLMGRKKSEGHIIQALILTPTRELAMQIDECFSDYGKYTHVKHACIFGGVKQNPQVRALRHGVDVLIATPGRLLDLIGQGEIKLSDLNTFVLDEADRMLDMGFICDIRKLVKMLPAKRQTLFFSATMPDEIVSLSSFMLNSPVRIEVTPAASTVDTINQGVFFVEKPEKKALLISVLKKERDKSVLVFSRTKHGADSISRILKKAGIESEAIHGNKSQNQRQRALGDFKSGKIKVMIATDIAARGIDIDELNMVINYDLPDVAETYVHRIGRTGRAGHGGIALSFCTKDETGMMRDIQKLTGKKVRVLDCKTS